MSSFTVQVEIEVLYLNTKVLTGFQNKDEGEGAGPSKRPRVGPMLEQTEAEDPQVGSRVVEALWALNTRLGEIQAEMVAGWEAALESV